MQSILLLDGIERMVYETILKAIKAGETKIFVDSSVSAHKVLDMVKTVLGEHPEFFYYDNCRIDYTEYNSKTVVYLSKTVNDSRLAEYEKQFRTEAQKIILQTIHGNMNKKQMVLAIHNYFVRNVQYDYGDKNPSSHTAYGAIVEKEAVCEGISAAFSYLLGLTGVRASVVNGSTEPSGPVDHCWNIVEVDGDFFHIDVTWDLKGKNNKNGICFDYFGLKDRDFNMRRWEKHLYPPCVSYKLNYFYLTKSVAFSEKDVARIAKAQFDRHRTVYVKLQYYEAVGEGEKVLERVSGIIGDVIPEGLIFHYNPDQRTVAAECTYN